MASYGLNIVIDKPGLTNIYGANQAVTLVKSVVTNALSAGNLPIAWLEFLPFEGNLVTWIENYYIYATFTALQSGATIVMTSQTPVPVQTGWTYTFANGQFAAAPGGAAGVYTVANSSSNNGVSFGLAQQASVNGTTVFAPLNAVSVLNGESATFTPQENVSIFLSAHVNNGAVISQIAGTALPVTLTTQSPSANIGFNDSSNTFYLQTPSLLSAHENALRLTLK